MKLRTKVILATTLIMGVSSAFLGGLVVAFTYQQGIANLQTDINRILTSVKVDKDPLSAALYLFAYADVNIEYEQEDGSITMLQQSYEKGPFNEVSERLDLGFDEALIISSSTKEIDNLVLGLIPIVLVSSVAMSIISSLIQYALLRNDVMVIRDLALFAQKKPDGNDLALKPAKVSREISQLVKEIGLMLEKIELNERNLREFLFDSSHELKTPLTVIRGYVEILQKSVKEDRPLEQLGKIHQEALKMQRLVDDLLLLAEISQGSQLELTHFYLLEVISAEIQSQQFLQPSLKISVDLPPNQKIFADKNLIVRFLSNALTNVRLHTPPGTEVRIHALEDDTGLRLSIEDSGPGLPNEIVEKIGTRFNSSRSDVGTGLGLSIMQKVIERHEGKLEFLKSELGGLRIDATLPQRFASPPHISLH